MREGVAGEQHGLEEDQRDRSDRGRPAERQQQHLRHHRLDHEEQSGGREDGGAVQSQRRGSPRRAGGRGEVAAPGFHRVSIGTRRPLIERLSKRGIP